MVFKVWRQKMHRTILYNPHSTGLLSVTSNIHAGKTPTYTYLRLHLTPSYK